MEFQNQKLNVEIIKEFTDKNCDAQTDHQDYKYQAICMDDLCVQKGQICCMLCMNQHNHQSNTFYPLQKLVKFVEQNNKQDQKKQSEIYQIYCNLTKFFTNYVQDISLQLNQIQQHIIKQEETIASVYDLQLDSIDKVQIETFFQQKLKLDQEQNELQFVYDLTSKDFQSFFRQKWGYNKVKQSLDLIQQKLIKLQTLQEGKTIQNLRVYDKNKVRNKQCRYKQSVDYSTQILVEDEEDENDNEENLKNQCQNLELKKNNSCVSYKAVSVIEQDTNEDTQSNSISQKEVENNNNTNNNQDNINNYNNNNQQNILFYGQPMPLKKTSSVQIQNNNNSIFKNTLSKTRSDSNYIQNSLEQMKQKSKNIDQNILVSQSRFIENNCKTTWEYQPQSSNHISLKLKNDQTSNIQLVGIRQNQIVNWKNNDTITFQIRIVEGRDLNKNEIFRQLIVLERENINNYISHDDFNFLDFKFSDENQVIIEKGKIYSICLLHWQHYQGYCGKGYKESDIFQFAPVKKEVEQFKSNCTDLHHGQLHTFLYKKI